MNRLWEFATDYQGQIESLDLPLCLAENYQVEALCRVGGGSRVYALRGRWDGCKYALKVTRTADGLARMAHEYQLLTQLKHMNPPVAPRPALFYREEGVGYLVSEFVPGESLNDLAERRGWVGSAAFCQAGAQLCRALEAIHRLSPPVIHRDLKPEHVILPPSPQAGARLVDFGVARRYRAQGEGDTMFLGSEVTAAPEQYGFAQTDRRTDIYAAGMTLNYLLTGSFDLGALPQAPAPRRLKGIIRRCTHFSPARRYPDAAHLRRALEWAHPRRRRRLALGLLLLLTPLLLLLGARAIVPLTPYAFTEPLIEQAVRHQLDKPQGPITRGDLLSVTALALGGDQPLDATPQAIPAAKDELLFSRSAPAQAVRSLEDVAPMANLRALSLTSQQITDLGPLTHLKRLETLLLYDNPISDLSPLSRMPQLKNLDVGKCLARDFTPLVRLPHLNRLSIAMCRPQDLRFLAQMPGLESLSVFALWPGDFDYSPYAAMAGLRQITVSDARSAHLAAIAQCPGVTGLTAHNCDLAALLAAVPQMEQLTDLGLYSMDIPDLDAFAPLANLTSLTVKDCPLQDISAILSLPNLQRLTTTSDAIADLTPILRHPALSYVSLPQSAASRLQALGPPAALHIEITPEYAPS